MPWSRSAAGSRKTASGWSSTAWAAEPAGNGVALSRQRRHRDAAARRSARRSCGGRRLELRAARHAAHARTADRRPRRCLALARLPRRLPGTRGLPAASRLARRGAPSARPADRVRGDVSSQFLSALLLALPLRGDAARRRHRSRRAADLEALRRHHDRPARSLRRRGSNAKMRKSFACAAARCCARRAASRSKEMHRRRRTSSPPLPWPPRRGRCASRAWAAARSRATSLSSTLPGRWVRRSKALLPGSWCGAGAGRWRRSTSTATPSPTPR